MYPKSISGRLFFYLRVTLVVIWFFGICFPLLLISLFRPFHHSNGTRFCRVVAPVSLWLLGLKVKLLNEAGFYRTRPCIFLGNHQHLLDLYTYSFILPTHTITLGKKSIRRVPIFGWLYWFAGQLLIDRGNSERAMATMKVAKEVLTTSGISLLVFPEGTRSRGKPMGKFKKGAFHLAVDTGLPLIPIVTSTYHTTVHLGKLHAGTVLMKVLDPIPVTGRSVADIERLMEESRSRMLTAIAELDAILLSGSPLPA